MMPAVEDIVAVVSEVWGTMLGLPIRPSEPEVFGSADRVAVSMVNIIGDSSGVVSVRSSLRTACGLAAAVFGLEPELLRTEDIVDGFGEIANIIGGNVKSLVPGSTSVSLPTVVIGHEMTLATATAGDCVDLHFSSDGSHLVISYWMTPNIGVDTGRWGAIASQK